MWFKNLKAYHLNQSLSLDDDDLQQALEAFLYRPCGNQELASMGFCSPFAMTKQGKDSTVLFHKAESRYWITLKKQERLLPSAVVNAELAEKVSAIEAETGSPVGKKQQSDIKQEIVHQLMPRAFTKHSYTHLYLCPDQSLVLVDAASHGSAETILAMLRKALGSLPVVPLARRSLQTELTQWVKEKPINTIELLEEAEFKSIDEVASVIRCKNQPLDSDEIQQHIDAGKWVQKVAIDYNDTLSAILCEDGSVKRIKFSDRLTESLNDIPKDEVLQRLDAEFLLMSGSLCEFVKAIDEGMSLTIESV